MNISKNEKLIVSKANNGYAGVAMLFIEYRQPMDTQILIAFYENLPPL